MLAAPAAAIGVVTQYLAAWAGGSRARAQEHGASAADLARWRKRLAGG